MTRAMTDDRLLVKGSPGYDQARTVWNAMVDRRPRAIARCVIADDVADAVRYGLSAASRSAFAAAGTACSASASRTAA